MTGRSSGADNMKVKTTNFLSSENEKMTVLFILDDNDMEIDRLSFYNKQSELSMSSELEKSLDRLPELLMKIYNSGLNHENIEFITDNISVE